MTEEREDPRKISTIIPTYEESERIGDCIGKIRERAEHPEQLEIIVSDGGSNDRTIEEAQKKGADQVLRAPAKGRATQMNHGAEKAGGKLLYFIHADAWPAKGFDTLIRESIDMHYRAGTFRFRFQPMKPRILWLNSFMTRFPWLFTQGGDRSLFLEKAFYQSIGGFNEEQGIMEDFEIIERIRKKEALRIVPAAVEVSPRKYKNNGYFRVQYANFKAMRLYKKGADPEIIRTTYTRILRPRTAGYS